MVGEEGKEKAQLLLGEASLVWLVWSVVALGRVGVGGL